MRALVSIGIACLIFSKTGAQSWVPVSNELIPGHISVIYEDSLNDRMIVGGSFDMNGEILASGFLCYDGNIFQSYGCAYNCVFPGTAFGPFSIASYHDTLYMQGMPSWVSNPTVNNVIGTSELCAFVDTNWLAISNGATNDLVTLVETVGDSLYVFSTGNMIAGIETNGGAIYSGTSWTPLVFPDAAENDFVYNFTSFTKFQNEHYITGNFAFGNGGNDIMKWNGIDWSVMPIDLADDQMQGIYCSVVYKDELYIGGTFQRPAGNAGEGIMKWDGEQWSDLGSGIFNGEVHSMVVMNEELYVCGLFYEAGGIPAHDVAKWDGNKWCSLGADFDGTYVRQMNAFRDSIYVGAYDSDLGFRLFKWTGEVDTCSVDFNSVQEQNMFNSIQLYPNPTNSELTISCNGINIIRSVVFDLLGKQIHSISANSRQVRLDTSGLAKGCYMIQVELDNGQIIVKKLMKE